MLFLIDRLPFPTNCRYCSRSGNSRVFGQRRGTTNGFALLSGLRVLRITQDSILIVTRDWTFLLSTWRLEREGPLTTLPRLPLAPKSRSYRRNLRLNCWMETLSLCSPLSAATPDPSTRRVLIGLNELSRSLIPRHPSPTTLLASQRRVLLKSSSRPMEKSLFRFTAS